MRNLDRGLVAALLLLASALSAHAQNYSTPPGAGGRNPACTRLEAQLSAIDRGTADPSRADQIRRYEDAVNKQQTELDKVVAQSRRAGCQGSGFLSLFSGQPAQCGQINTQIQQMRSNLDQLIGTLQQMQGNTAGREGERRSVLIALADNDCGPQYRQAAMPQQRGFFDTLFGPGTIMQPEQPVEPTQSSTYRTVCVRTCDGYFFPISYSASPDRFAQDEQTCQRACPSAEVRLYTFRNQGEEIAQAVSLSGQPYTELPTAFAYRKEFNKACGCKRTDQTWSDAMKTLEDNTIQQGDIIVTDERARQLSAAPASGKRNDPPRAVAKPGTQPSPAPSSGATISSTNPATGEKKQIRTVGPTFIPAQ